MVKIKTYAEHDFGPMGEDAPRILEYAVSRMPMPFWVSAGTALGLYRNGDFIKGDTDIDLAMVGYDGVEKVIMDRFSDCQLLRTMHLKDKVMQLAFLKDGYVIDTYYHYRQGDNFVNYSDRGKTIIPASMYQIKLLDTKYGLLPFPNPIKDYLFIRYGKYWRRPRKGKPKFKK